MVPTKEVARRQRGRERKRKRGRRLRERGERERERETERERQREAKSRVWCRSMCVKVWRSKRGNKYRAITKSDEYVSKTSAFFHIIFKITYQVAYIQLKNLYQIISIRDIPTYFHIRLAWTVYTV